MAAAAPATRHYVSATTSRSPLPSRFVGPRTLRGTLVALIAITLVPLLGFGIYLVADEYEHRRDLEARASAELARAVAAGFDGFVQSVLRTQQAIAASVAVHGQTVRQLEDELARVNAEFPMSRDMSWIDPRGTIVASTELQLRGKSMFGREYYQAILRGADWYVTPVMQSVVDGAPIIIITRALRADGGELVGIVAAAIDAERLRGLLGIRSDGGTIAILDSTGTIVAREPTGELDWEARQAARNHESVRKALAGTEALGVYSWPSAPQRRVGALVPIPSIGWVAHASRPIDAALGPVREAAIHSAAVLSVVALAALGAALFLARRIAEPLSALEEHARRLAMNGPVPAPVRGPAEVRRVARALEAMATSLARRRADLEALNRRLSESEERYRSVAAAAEADRAELEAIIAALPIGVGILDPDRERMRFNEVAREILGATQAEVEGTEEVRRVFELSRPDGTVLAIGERPADRALRGEIVRGEIVRVERREGGPATWVSANAAPIRGREGGIRGAVVAFLDVTELRELQEERETLMHTVSHDLRTPLHVIVGHAEMLRRRGDEETRRRSEAILASAGRMTRLIGDLVDAASLEAGHVALHLEPVDLVAFLAGWKDRMSGALATQRVRVVAPAAVPVIMADAARLDQILVNLVSNALKYSVEESDVQIELTATGSALRLSVADRGPGIAPEELPHLFERYYRAKSAVRAEGLGLGLFITRKLVDAHGWRIEVVSEPGRGSAFTLVIPIAPAHAAHVGDPAAFRARPSGSTAA